ncbi:MAG: DUF47 family protein [Clostridiales bacterium]|jgi:uncharacterized protein Yka (UPF0111/DUF47 family)|nr:DUF47 family protein [Clostridiales bacterium]
MGKSEKFDYFDYFAKAGQFALQAAEHLKETLDHFDPNNIKKRMEEIHVIENDSDNANHTMLKHLTHEFMTPIELEDIVALSGELDDLVDSLDDITQHMYMYGLLEATQEMKEFSGLIIRSVSTLLEALKEFRTFRKSKELRQLLIEINNIESEGDKLYSTSMRRQFLENNDYKTLIGNTRIYEMLEACLDDCEDVADVIEGIIMKNT